MIKRTTNFIDNEFGIQSVQQAKAATGITWQKIESKNVVGEFILPAGEGPFPAVLCIGGSSGGSSTVIAPLLAQIGFAALSIGYFGAPGLPETFANIPIERFLEGVDWLLNQPIVLGSKVAVTGTSRGSEAALQTAALTTKISALIAYVPSGIRWMGVNGQPSWTYKGKALPYVQWENNFNPYNAIAKVGRFNQILDNPSTFFDAEIEVEKASCPILLISGKEDQLWPSERMATRIIERLKKYDYPYSYRHISYPNAGHRIKVPGLDQNSYEPISEDTVTHEKLQLGGTYEGNKSASQQSWIEAVKFLQNALN